MAARTRTRAALFVSLLLLGTCRPEPAPRDGPGERVEATLVSAPDESFSGELRIAVVFPTVGRYGPSGVQCLNGTRLAIEDLDRQGAIHGRRVRLLEYTTGSFLLDARHAAERAVTRGGVLAIVGANASSLSMPIAEVAEEQHVVQISNISTAEALTWDPATGRERPFVFRVCGSDAEMGALLAEFASDHLRARRVAVLYEVGRAYSAQLAQSFIRAFRGPAGERTVDEFFYLPREVDFRPQLRAIREFGPDVLFIPGSFADATLVARQAAAVGLGDVTLLGGDAWSNRLLFKLGPPSGRAFYADLCSPPEDFGERYQRVFGAEADGCRAVLGYDAILAVAEALRALGPLDDRQLTTDLPKTRVRMRRALAAVDFSGRTGRIRFDKHRNREGGMAVMEVVTSPAGDVMPRLYLLDHAS